MGLAIKKGSVPRAAVEKTIRRGVELWQLANDNRPCPPHVVKQITQIVHRQAHIMNIERGYDGNETRNLKGLN